MPAEGRGAILVDANLLLLAHHRQFERHDSAHAWWAETLSTVPIVGIPWTTSLAFLRISTHARALTRPLAIEQAWRVVEGWLTRSNVRCPVPTERHGAILGELLVTARASANHVPDAHLAAIAIEWGLELVSADHDFARYPGLRWRDPLSAAPAS
jgi:toxin-antitoxin system PIN domain toxin